METFKNKVISEKVELRVDRNEMERLNIFFLYDFSKLAPRKNSNKK
jgi:hypothetical protein